MEDFIPSKLPSLSSSSCFFLDLIYIYYCKCKILKINCWGLLSMLLFIPIFTKLKRILSFLSCSIRASERKYKQTGTRLAYLLEVKSFK